ASPDEVDPPKPPKVFCVGQGVPPQLDPPPPNGQTPPAPPDHHLIPAPIALPEAPEKERGPLRADRRKAPPRGPPPPSPPRRPSERPFRSVPKIRKRSTAFERRYADRNASGHERRLHSRTRTRHCRACRRHR